MSHADPCSRREFLLGSSALVLAATGMTAHGEEPAKVPTIDEWIKKQAKDAPLKMRFQGTTADECRKWQKEFADKLRTLLGPHSPPKEWKTTLESSVEKEDHLFEEFILTADDHPPLPVCVLTPRGKEEKRAGVLAIHGHGANGHYAIAKGASGKKLVSEGYVVVAPCLTPFGRRLDNPEAYGKQDPCGVTFVRLQLLGKVLIAENLRDTLWAFEHMSRLKGVDPRRLGCVGLSYGGRMTMLTTALEPRIQVAVISGALNVLQERILGRYSCGAQIIPGLLQFGDVPEISSLIAPRPCVFEVGTQDTLIDPTWAEEALARIKKAYKALNAEGNLILDRFEGGHTWSWAQALPTMKKTID